MRSVLLGALLLAACGPTGGVAAPSPTAASSATASRSAAASPAASATPSPTASPAPTPAPTAIPKVKLERAFGGAAFNSMTSAVQAPSGRWFVLEQPGRVMTFTEADPRPALFLDIRDRVEFGGEKGLLGIALAPDFDTSGVFFLDYTRGGPLRTEIASFTSSGAAADKASERVLLEIAQPFDNHNGGQLAFGPDGYLYIAMGDGGSGGDPFGNGQNRNALLGKILRIDVKDRTTYQVPPDNPFAAGGGRGEIFAFGLRNPWRFSFDGADLWVGDVGQNLYEEVDLVTKGGNYGWNVMEGLHCYNAPSCNMSGLALPVLEYGHDGGACSITGGFVYRGSAVPDLVGAYVYGDYCNGKVWALRYAGGKVIGQAEIVSAGFQISSFARDARGEVYVLQYGGSGGIFRLAR